MIRVVMSILVALAMTVPGVALAVQPDEVLDNPVLEQRARSISANLRCMVCQNQSIDDSDAALARDLRLVVRERLVNGDTDTEVYDFVVARYGEFVLLRPVFAGHTILLWVATPVLLAIGLGITIWAAIKRRKTKTGNPALSNQERKALEELRKS